jgi:hypothetical protein
MLDDTNLLAHAQINVFHNRFDSTPASTVTLAHALEMIRTGVYADQVRLLQQILTRQGKATYDREKAYRLAAFTFTGRFLPTRGNANLRQHSGIVHGDLDHLRTVVAIKQAIADNPRTAYAFISPSGVGLKLGVHIPLVPDDTAYKHAWHAVSTAYEALYGERWDPSGKDVSRLCFLSHDPALYWNPDAVVFEVPPVPIPKPRPPTPQLSVPRQHICHLDYAGQAIRTAGQMIETAELGMRHHTRLKAARLLVGYVAGGLLSEDQAYGALAHALVGHTDDLERALKTVVDGLKYGQAHPITLEALEADRQAWAAQRRPTEPLRAPDDPWDGIPTLPLRPYLGYRGITSRRGQLHG